MDPLAPVAGLSLERYAEISAEVAAARGNAAAIAEALARAGVSAPDWELAQTSWSARLADPALGIGLVSTFEAHHHATLDRLLGPVAAVSAEELALRLGEALVAGLPAMAQRRGLDPLAWSRLYYCSRAALVAEPARLAACLGLAEHVAARRLAEMIQPPAPAAPRPAAAAPASPPAAAEAAAAPGATKVPARAFEQDATVAAKALGRAALSGLDAFGSAIDAMSKSLVGPSVGARVLVRWSDGVDYPGTVAKLGNGQIEVTMADGSAHWIPSAFVKMA